jgi:hypothetical protein
MTLSVELLSETAASSAIRIDDNLYVNVWTTAPTVQQLQVVVAAERQMRHGYRSLEVVERADKLMFEKGVRDTFQKYAEEFAGRAVKNIVVMRAGGFAGAVVHGLVGMFNVVGVATPLTNTLEEGVALWLDGAEHTPTIVLPIVQAHIARHVAQHPPPGR